MSGSYPATVGDLPAILWPPKYVPPHTFTTAGPTRASSLGAIAAVSVAVLCGTGIAAFAGLLPASGTVASAVTVTPLIDMQVDAYLKRVATMQ
jgi:hypothetical protein